MNRNCAMAASLQYLLLTMQETVRKEKNAKFSRKSTQLPCMVIRLKNPKKILKGVVWKRIRSKRNSEHEFEGNKYMCGACNRKV